MVLKYLFIIAVCCGSYFHSVTADFTDFQLIGKMSINKPAFLSFISSKDSIDLTVSQFGQVFDGQVSLIQNVSSTFTTDSTVSFDSLNVKIIGENFTWPNDVSILSKDVLTDEKQEVLCGTESCDCQIVAVPDGFLTPGHQTGSVYLQAIVNNVDSPLSSLQIVEEEQFWYYHRVLWVDMDNDGILDILAARAWTNNIGMTKAQLIWLKQPTSLEDFQKPWKLTVLTEGPDVIILADESIEGYIYVYAPEFFGEKLSLTIIKKAEEPEVVSYSILDDTIGAGYDAHLGDANGDGVRDLIISTHEGKSGGYIFAYEFPTNIDDYTTAKWERHTLVSGFTVEKRGLNQASPGFIFPFFTASSTDPIKGVCVESTPTSTDCVGRPWFLVAGDGSESVHIVSPLEDDENKYAYQMDTIITVGGTVGSLAIIDTSSISQAVGNLTVAVPDYDHDQMFLYTFFIN